MLKNILFFFVFVPGCATIKPYPVCFYDPIPPDKIKQKEHVTSLETTIKEFSKNVHSSPDGRWIFAKTGWIQHNKLSKTWPRVSCIGKVTSGTEVKRYQDCIYYVKEFLESKNYIDLDVKNNVPDSDEALGKKHVICSRVP